MIIKKPYAFMIKHFRLIHLLLLIPMIYLLTQTRQIITFFSDYVASNYSLSATTDVLSSLASNYINVFMYLAVIIIMATFIIVSILLQRKEKPTRFYNISIVYYLVLFILITASFAVFTGIENDTIDAAIMRLIRDLAVLVHYSQYIFIIFTAIRGIGFNIKKFDFKSDLDELEISSEDSEEVEFLVGIDTYKTKRSIRRFFRELKYYYKENKFIFIMIFVIVIGIIGTMLYMNEEVYQRVYNENDSMALGYLNFVIKDSYISNLSQNGEVLNEDKYYVILQLEITNRYRESHEFSYSSLELNVNDEYFHPNLSIANYFKDYGTPYNGTYIQGNSTGDYILVYEIDSYLINQNFLITVFSHYDASVGGIGVVNDRIRIRPDIVDSNIVTNYVNLGTNISLANTNLGNSEIRITDYEFTNRYTYSYEYCINDSNCIPSTAPIQYNNNGGRTMLLVLGYDLLLDNEIPYMDVTKTYRSFFEDFIRIQYTVNGINYQYRPSIANPSSYNEKVVLAVPREMANADEVALILTVRNRSYQIRLQ